MDMKMMIEWVWICIYLSLYSI